MARCDLDLEYTSVIQLYYFRTVPSDNCEGVLFRAKPVKSGPMQYKAELVGHIRVSQHRRTEDSEIT